jgi:hypothetical protein
MGDGLKDFATGTFNATYGAKKAKSAAKNRRKEDLNFIENLNWDPAYGSDRAPTFQRSQSPVARSYLDSFLLGTNPDATSSTAPNAKYIKAQQQAKQNQQFGTPEARLAQQQQIQQATPWKVESPAESYTDAYGFQSPGKSLNDRTEAGNNVYGARNPGIAAAGITEQDLASLDRQGVIDSSDTVDGQRFGPRASAALQEVNRLIDAGATPEELEAARNKVNLAQAKDTLAAMGMSSKSTRLK